VPVNLQEVLAKAPFTVKGVKQNVMKRQGGGAGDGRKRAHKMKIDGRSTFLEENGQCVAAVHVHKPGHKCRRDRLEPKIDPKYTNEEWLRHNIALLEQEVMSMNRLYRRSLTQEHRRREGSPLRERPSKDLSALMSQLSVKTARLTELQNYLVQLKTQERNSGKHYSLNDDGDLPFVQTIGADDDSMLNSSNVGDISCIVGGLDDSIQGALNASNSDPRGLLTLGKMAKNAY
jgi:hypothetical protein